MRIRFLSLALLIMSACGPADPAILLNAPPDLGGARVYVDERYVGELKTTHSYRWGAFSRAKEMAAPPRYEANLEVERLAEGVHRLRIAKGGYAEYRATFRNGSSHVEVFVPDEAVRKTAAN